MKNDCIFCAIAAGEIPCFKVYEDDVVLAYLDINPCTKGHTLVIPKAHSAGLLDTPPDAVMSMPSSRLRRSYNGRFVPFIAPSLAAIFR